MAFLSLQLKTKRNVCNRQQIIRCLLLSFLFIFYLPSSIAASLAKDSINPQLSATLNDTWYLGSEPETRHVIDTTIFNLEQYNPAQNDGIEYTNAGNFGSAAFPLLFRASKTIGFNAGYNQFDLYRYKKDSVKYYQVIRPYTELAMMIGLRNEQYFQGKFANRHKEIISYGVEFTRIFSKGAYTNQRVNFNGFNLYGIFHSKNKHWKVQADLLFNSNKVQENGGVTVSVFDSAYFQKNLAPVQLREAENNYRQTDFYLTSSYIAGKKYKEYVNDSTSKNVLVPLFSISHVFNVEKSRHKFRDYAPKENYYNSFYHQDSVFNDLDYLKLGNALQLEYKWRKLTSDTSYENKNLVIQAVAGFDYYLLEQNFFKNNFGNLYVGGTVRNNTASRSRVVYKGTVKYYPYGWNQHDFLADAAVGYDFGKWGMLTANFTLQRNEAPYIYERYTSHPAVWNFNLPKTNTLTFGAKYQNLQWGIVAEANYYNVQNLPVYPGLANPYFNLQKENFLVAHIGNRNGIKGFHFDNDIWLTVPFANNTITDYYALLFTKHSLFYEVRVFKKVLWLATGFDLRMRYRNNPPFYEPLTGAFYPSFSNMKFVPQFDFFLNLKIKTVRVFLKVDNILSGIGLKGYYSLYQYPAPDLSFKVGIRWRFFE